jgi:hypothetical protein
VPLILRTRSKRLTLRLALAPTATAFSFSGPATGTVNVASSPFTVTPSASWTGSVTITPSGGGLSTPIVLTWSGSSSAQTFNITPTAAGTVTLTPTNSGGLTNPAALTCTVSAASSSYTVAGPAALQPGVPSAFTVTPTGGKYTGNISLTQSGGGVTSWPTTTLTWSNSSAGQQFWVVSSATGSVTVSSTNSGGLTDPSPVVTPVSVSAVSSYYLNGPGYALSGVASPMFAVTLGPGNMTGSVTITPSDSAGGTFSPSSVTLTADSRAGFFQYTPPSGGATRHVATTNSLGWSNPASVSVVVTAPTSVTIDSTWLANPSNKNADGSYKLAAYTVYTLATNVTTLGRAFSSSGGAYVLDLNGYTVIYDNNTPLVVTNGGFETGDFTGWDVSLAPTASVVPQYLMWGSYMGQLLNFSATQTVTSSPVSIPTTGIPYVASCGVAGTANQGHLTTKLLVIDATPGHGSPTLVTTSLGGGKSAGMYACFTPAAGVTQVQLQLQATPDAGQTCSEVFDYAAIQRSGVSQSGTGVNANSALINGVDASYRLAPLIRSSNTTTWSASGGTYTNDLAATSATQSVLSSGSRSFVAGDVGNGVYISGGTNFTTGIYYIQSVASGSATLDRNCTTGSSASGGSGRLGGMIVQGQGRSYMAYPVCFYAGTSCMLDGVMVYGWGMDTSLVFGNGTIGHTVRNCTLVGGVEQISNRMALYAFVYAQNTHQYGCFTGNTLTGGHQSGIVFTGTPSSDGIYNPSTCVLIANNSASQRSYWTDGYGIEVSQVRNFEIAGNTLTPMGARGIIIDCLGTMILDGSVHDNTTDVQEYPNYEFGRGGLEATSLRLRSGPMGGTGSMTRLHVYNNTFYSHTSTGQDWACIGNRCTLYNTYHQMDNAGILFENNTFRAVVLATDGMQDAYAVDLARVEPGINLTYKNNTFKSNDISINLASDDGINENDVLILAPTLTKDATGISVFDGYDYAWTARTAYTSLSGGTGNTVVSNVRIISPVYAGGATLNNSLFAAGSKDIFYGWQLTVHVVDGSGTPQVGAAVTVTDNQGTVQFTGTTDASGNCSSIPINTTEYSTPGNSGINVITTTDRSHLTINATSGAKSGSSSPVLTSDSTVTVTVS